MIEMTSGSIFTCEAEALVCPVNTVGVVDKGLALEFKKRFPANFKNYEEDCREGNFDIGEVLANFVQDTTTGEMRWIVNFPTKRHWRDSSRLEWIESGLQGLRAFVAMEGVRSIAIPPLGAKLGGQDWDRAAIEENLGDLPGVRVLLFLFGRYEKRSGEVQ